MHVFKKYNACYDGGKLESTQLHQLLLFTTFCAGPVAMVITCSSAWIKTYLVTHMIMHNIIVSRYFSFPFWSNDAMVLVHDL